MFQQSVILSLFKRIVSIVWTGCVFLSHCFITYCTACEHPKNYMHYPHVVSICRVDPIPSVVLPWHRDHHVTATQITKTLGSISIRYWSHAKMSDRCVMDIDPKVFAIRVQCQWSYTERYENIRRSIHIVFWFLSVKHLGRWISFLYDVYAMDNLVSSMKIWLYCILPELTYYLFGF